MEFQLKSRQKLLHFEQPQVMGIININSDSFYSESRATTEESIRMKADLMIQDGAKILDLGAMSTRPGAQEIPLDQEMEQIKFALNSLRKDKPDVLISIDTYRFEVAQMASEMDVDFINDISAGEDDLLLDLVAKEQLGYIAMHKQGMPVNMQINPSYENVTREIAQYFIQKGENFLKKGITSWCMDPGFGFGKTSEHNFQLMNELNELKLIVNKPLLIGISRKGMIYKTLNSSAADALNGTTAMHMTALMNGADILRVHDVKEAMEVVTLFTQLQKNK
jgi:dihydropteroate synthase